MTEQKKGAAPDFKGDGIAIWKNKTKDGELYLTVQILGNVRVPCFKFEPKVKSEKIGDI